MLAYRPIILVFPLLFLGMVIADPPKGETIDSNYCCSVKNSQNVAPNYNGFIPNIPNMVPNIPNMVPNIPNMVPNLQNIIPNLQNIIPNFQNIVPNFQNIVPNNQNTMLPANYVPNHLPADYLPNHLPADYLPNELPPDYLPNTLPADRLINPNGSSCGAPSYLCRIGKPNITLPRRDDYKYTSGIGSHKFHTRSKTWNEARKVCNDEGAHLAIINSDAEMNILRELFLNAGPTKDAHLDNPYKVAFIGTHDLYKEGDWVTVLGESLSKTGYTVWSNMYGRQPDNGNGIQNCGGLFQDGTGMDDINCDVKFPFFCEIPERCIPH